MNLQIYMAPFLLAPHFLKADIYMNAVEIFDHLDSLMCSLNIEDGNINPTSPAPINIKDKLRELTHGTASKSMIYQKVQ